MSKEKEKEEEQCGLNLVDGFNFEENRFVVLYRPIKGQVEGKEEKAKVEERIRKGYPDTKEIIWHDLTTEQTEKLEDLIKGKPAGASQEWWKFENQQFHMKLMINYPINSIMMGHDNGQLCFVCTVDSLKYQPHGTPKLPTESPTGLKIKYIQGGRFKV